MSGDETISRATLKASMMIFILCLLKKQTSKIGKLERRIEKGIDERLHILPDMQK